MFYAVVFCAVSLRIVFQTFISEIVPFSIVSFRKLFRFPAKPTRFVIARRARAPDAAIFNKTICHPEANYGCAERNRTINKERESGMKQGIHVFVIGIPFCFVLPCFATGCHASNFKIATAALRPRNDTKLGRFCLENRRILFYAVVFLRGVAPHRLSNVHSGNCSVFNRFVPEIVPFSRKTHQICHCEEGAAFAPDAAILNGTICHPVTNYGRAERNRTINKERGSRMKP